MSQESLNQKVDFILLVAHSLQACGAAAHHLERALSSVGRGLGLGHQFLAFPTGLIASFQEGEHHRGTVIRFEPGQIDLSKLSRIDEIADHVLEGKLSIQEGTAAIQATIASAGDYSPWIQVLAYALAAGGFVTALKGTLLDLIVAVGLGIVIGLIEWLGKRSSFLEQLFAPLAACIVTLVATLLAREYTTISPDLVILASIVALLPGLTLVIAFVELATKNLISGTARLAGASGDLMKLVFTIAITKKLLADPAHPALATGQGALPPWAEIFGVAALAFGFIVLFKVRPKHALSSAIVSITAYTCERFFAINLGIELSFFATGALVAVISNSIARMFRRPGLITLLPGIILIVPGSVNYRSMTTMFQNDVIDTMQTTFSVIIIAVSLVAGLVFGNTIVPPRRSL